MALRIVIDARRIRDFGIGTYIRSLVHALCEIDHENRYTLVSSPTDAATLSGMPANFEVAVYRRKDSETIDHVTFPVFLHGLGVIRGAQGDGGRARGVTGGVEGGV